MEHIDIHADLRQLLVILLGILPHTDERRQFAQQIASRHGMNELLDDRQGIYEGGDG